MSRKEEGAALLTISQAADFLNVSKVTVRRWTNDGKLPCSRVGSRGERRFLESDLRQLISRPHAPDKAMGELGDQAKGAHRCVLCDESQQGWSAIVQEIVAHLANEAHVTFIGDASRQQRAAKAIEKSGFDLEAILGSDRLRLLSVEESYLVSGTFSGSRAAAFVESTILDARSRGFDCTLFVGWSDWLFSAQQNYIEPGNFEVAEYERILGEMVQRYPDSTILCPYTFSDITSATLIELASYHTQIQFQSQVVFGQSSSGEPR